MQHQPVQLTKTSLVLVVAQSETDTFPLLAYEGHVDAAGGLFYRSCLSCGGFSFHLSSIVKCNSK